MIPQSSSPPPEVVFRWEPSLTRGQLLGRRHRFLVDVKLECGTTVVAHCANPGCMEGLVRPGAEVWLSESSSSKRTLQWTWELVRVDGVLIGANSWTANRLVKTLLERRKLPGLKRFIELRSERRQGKGTRLDFELISGRRSHFVEVKNGHLVYPDGAAYFPDSVTVRSVKHLTKLRRLMNAGHAATVIVTVQRSDAQMLRPSDLHDPVFAAALRSASRAGLKIRALKFEPSPVGFSFLGELPVDLRPYSADGLAAWRLAGKRFSGWARPKANSLAAWRKGKQINNAKGLNHS